MLRTTVSIALAATALAALAGCNDGFDAPEERIGSHQEAIINGIPDTTHDAVVAVFSMMGACSGTVIEMKGDAVFVLTAAHCFRYGDLVQVRIGDNYQNPDQVLTIDDFEVHPQYDENDNQLPYDFAIVRAGGADSNTPIIPALTPQEDSILQGTPITHVGYGKLSYPDGGTSVRHRGSGSIDQVGSIQIAYAQPNQGPCEGDSGGPQLVNTPGGERAAGVTSFGAQGCTQYGVSGRVSGVYNGFIEPFIDAYTPPPDPTTGAGGAGGDVGMGGGGGAAGVTTGAGAGNASNGYEAGTEDQKYQGEVLVNGCSVGDGSDHDNAAWLALSLCLLGYRRRRRQH